MPKTIKIPPLCPLVCIYVIMVNVVMETPTAEGISIFLSVRGKVTSTWCDTRGTSSHTFPVSRCWAICSPHIYWHMQRLRFCFFVWNTPSSFVIRILFVSVKQHGPFPSFWDISGPSVLLLNALLRTLWICSSMSLFFTLMHILHTQPLCHVLPSLHKTCRKKVNFPL